MLTKNYWLFKAYLDEHGVATASEPANIEYVNLNMIDISGINRSMVISFMSPDELSLVNFTMKYGLKVILGSNKYVEPTINDYHLTTPLNNVNATLNYNITVGSDGNNNRTMITISGNNPDSRSVQINEIGIIKPIACGLRYGALEQYDYLVDREILESEIIVPANSPFTMTYQWVEQ